MENTYRMNIDLKGRMRYIGLNVSPTLTGTNGGAVVAIGTLGRAADSTDIGTVATGVAGMRLNVSG